MPWIDLEGAVNARDLGGLPAGDGLQIAPRTLLRSDNLQDLTPADIATLVDDFDLTTVIDLRSAGEKEAEGQTPLQEAGIVAHYHLSVLPELGRNTDVAADALLLKRERDRSLYPDDATCGHYLGYLEDRPESVTAAVRAIAEAPGAALVHCAAGKDRTGVVVALTLTAVGVPAEEVIADYTRTDERIEGILRRLRGSLTYQEDLEKSEVDRHRPRPETMKAMLEQIDVRYGGAAAWLASHGFGPDELARLRARLTESAPSSQES